MQFFSYAVNCCFITNTFRITAITGFILFILLLFYCSLTQQLTTSGCRPGPCVKSNYFKSKEIKSSLHRVVIILFVPQSINTVFPCVTVASML